MAAVTTLGQLTTLYEKYAPSIETLYQTADILQKDIDFVEGKKKNGGNYHQPVVMSPEQGFTYAAPNENSLITMNAAISMNMQEALVAPYQMGARWVLNYEAAFRSINGGAFEPSALLQLGNVTEQAKNRLEFSLLYGQSGLGVADSSVNASATSTVLTYSVGSWADATFGTLINAEVQFFDTVSGALISSGADSKFTITSVNTVTRAVTVTGTATGIGALDTGVAGVLSADMFLSGTRVSASVFNEMPGLQKIITNTGTLFNINAAAYDLWKGNTYAAGGALTFAKLQSAIALAIGKGLLEDVVVYVNPKTWGNLLTEQSALRRLDSSYSDAKTKNGSKAIEFYTQSGKMTVKSHPFVKQGDAFVIPPSRLARVGSTDITFNVPSANGEKNMWIDLPDSMGYQAKLYSAQTLFCATPAKTVMITGVINS